MTFNGPNNRQSSNLLRRVRQLLFMLPLLLMAAGAGEASAAFLVGKNPVCLNDTANYFVAGGTPGITYLLGPVSPHGITSGPSGGVLNVQWIASGTGKVWAWGIDSGGDTVETLDRSVTIRNPPVPYLTTSYRVACQELTGSGGGQPQPPDIYDTSKCQLVCSGAAVTYYGHGSSGSTFTWSATNAAAIFPMGDSCIVVWGGPGRGTVTVYETNTVGCTGSLTFCFEVLERPLAHFETYAIYTDNDNSTSNSITICREDNVIFKDISTGPAASPILSCWWDFGDGNYMTTASPTTLLHQYNTPGSYTAMLVVRNACGCVDTARVNIDVRDELGVRITCPSVVCEGQTAGYKVHDYVSCPVFHWTVLGGTIIPAGTPTDSITVIWDNVDEYGFGYVMFDAGPCGADCNGSAIIKVPVIQNNGTIQGPKTICVGTPAMYRMPQWPTTRFNWNTTSVTATLDSTDQWNETVVTASAPGTIVLRVNYRNTLLGCGGVAYDTIEVVDRVDVLNSGRYCEGTYYTWTLTSAAVGDWTLIRPDGSIATLPGSNSLTAYLNQPGSYRLFVGGNFCGPDTIRFDVTPKPPSIDSLIGPDKACAGVPTRYQAYTLLSGYMFGWGASPGSVSPPGTDVTWATFSGPGPYEIRVWRTDMLGCPSDTFRKTVLSPVVPVNISGPLVVCGSTVHPYEVDYLEGETYDWEIWDDLYSSNYIGSVTLPADSSHIGVTWNNPSGATETAHLIVHVRKCGIVMSDTIDVVVNGAPVLSISGPASVCSGTGVTFTASATPPITSSGLYEWDFGDGFRVSSYPAASHVYNTGTLTTTVTFPVTLTIALPNGCGATISDSARIDVVPAPVFRLTDLSLVPQPFNHCGASTWTNLLGPSAPIAGSPTYEWSKSGVGVVGTAATLAINETTWGTGVYALKVTVGGCSTTEIVTISDDCDTCSPLLRPTLTLKDTIPACAHVHIDGNWSPKAWGYNPSWHYHGPDIRNLVTTDTTFDADFLYAGIKQIFYRVKYLSGTDTCEVEDTAEVNVPYVARLGADFYCSGGAHILTVQDFSSVSGAVPVYLFYVDGVLHTSTSTPFYSFDVSGLTPGSSHTILLKVKAPGFDTCYAGRSVTVPPVVDASFTIPKFNPACIFDAVVEFTNTTIAGIGSKAHWNFDDGSTNDLWSPWKVYGVGTIGDHLVTLTVTDRYGCSDTYSDTVRVEINNLNGQVLASSSFECSGTPIVLTYDPTPGPGMPTSFEWYEQTRFLDSNTSATRTVYEPGGYWLTGIDNFGCKDKTPVAVVDFNRVPEAVISGDTSACQLEPYTLYYPAAAYPAGAVYTWLENGLVVGTSATELTRSNFSGTYVYRLVIAITVGITTCTDTSDPFTVIVHPAPAVPVITPSVLDCEDYQVQLDASSTSPGTYNWSSGDAGTPVVVRTGGPYRVWLTDEHGCIAYSDIDVPKSPDVYKYVFPVGCYNLCQNEAPFTLLAPKFPAYFDRWDWLYSGSSVSGGMGYPANYDVFLPGTYNFAMDNGSCPDTTDDLNISFKNCPDGCFGSIQLIGVTRTSAPGGVPCYDTVELGITCPPGTTYTISGDNGIFLPGTGTGPSPGTKYRYIADPGFSGPMDFITAIFTNPLTGMSCRRRIPLPIMPCANSTAKRAADNTGAEMVVNEFARLLLRPNPASSSVRIDYGFTGEASQRSVEVYDMAGRKIAARDVYNDSGTAVLELDALSPGLYQVVLRQNGQVFLHAKLSVVR